MKKIIYLVLAVFLLTGMIFTSCSKDSGKLICGVTEYEPMNYRDARGNWIGFDTEFAQLVGEKLGMEVEFQLIEWSQKFAELNSRSISVIWNGFTATANEPDGTPRINLCDMSYSYMRNTQCVVIRADRVREFTSAESLIGKTLTAEAGSAGETKAKELAGETGRIIGTPAQINTFMEVKSGAVDGAVMDIILAEQIAGFGDYSDLIIADIELGDEVYAIGFRKGDPLRNRINQAMKELYDDGTLAEIAAKYGLGDRLVLDTNFGR
ncbi:MAG: transporter substrate-binding domain-containing protein [Treponema sp.]|nr:transporter substrate-binding domain-containing protein [Treponema sp.]